MGNASGSRSSRSAAGIADVRDRLVLLTNIPTPYRISFFDVLADVLETRNCELLVLYCAESEPNRQWKIEPAAIRHAHRILPGMHLTLRKGYFHLNTGVLKELSSHPPRWLVVGGAWHMPTALLAIASPAVRSSAKILWSEGHADAVLHRKGAIAAVRRRVYARYQAVAVPNARSGEFALAEIGADRPVLPLANTVDEDFYRPPSSSEAAEARRRLGVEEDQRVLVTVCQLVDRKSVLELASAFRDMNRTATSPRLLVFVGDGERREELEQIARSLRTDEIRIAGHLAMEDVRRWLWAADGFVLATRSDPNPLSPIEASLAGLPLILSSKSGNVDELLLEGETGWRLDPSSIDSIATALARFFSADSAMLRGMGQSAARHTSRIFRRRAVAERFVDALVDTFPRSTFR
jgi:glycosyltransferase involved in cell wall biosynthesis